MSSSALVIYSESNDPLIASLAATENGSALCDVMHVDELVEYLSPLPWPNVLSIDLPSDLACRFQVDVVVNRLFTLAGTSVADRLIGWGVSERWFHVRMTPYLRRATRLAYDCGVRGVSKCLMPLNTQWYHVDRDCSGISTPLFFYALGNEAPEISRFNNPMQKSIWSIFDWKQENNITPSESRRHRFMVERPTGTPVIYYYLGDGLSDFIYPKGRAFIPDSVTDELHRLCRHRFKSEAGEVLVYVEDDGGVRFYGFSPFLNSATGSAEFGRGIIQWLDLRRAA